jgi:putative transposase
VVGVDLGITSLAVLSTGEVIANPRHLEVALKELRRLQRQAGRRVGPDKRTRQQPSQRWRTTHARVAKLHTTVANARRDGLHHLTTRLVREHPHDSDRGPACRRDAPQPAPRRIAGVSMGEPRRQIEYKTGWAGSTLHVTDRWSRPRKPVRPVAR